MTDKFRLDIRPSDIDVDHANWLIDRQSARIQELAAERDALKAAGDELATIVELVSGSLSGGLTVTFTRAAEDVFRAALSTYFDISKGKTDDQ